MKFDPDRHHRRSIRLPGYDYSQPGAYFVTICTYQRTCILGSVQDDFVLLSPSGQKAEQCWRDLPDHFTYIELDAFVIMPNHLHGIIIIRDRNTGKSEQPGSVNLSRQQSSKGTQSGSLNALIQNFKSVSTRKINQILQNRGATIWQRNYYEQIIRDEMILNNIRHYIEVNPAQWTNDEEYRGATL